jgi:hypothetical protein
LRLGVLVDCCVRLTFWWCREATPADDDISHRRARAAAGTSIFHVRLLSLFGVANRLFPFPYGLPMATTEWWQRGPVDGVPDILQPVAHILLQVRESVDELVADLTEEQWNARPAGVASASFHVRHIAGVIDRLFTYARGEALTEAQFTSLRGEGEALHIADVPEALRLVHRRVDAAVEELRSIDISHLVDFRPVGRAQLPSTVIGCLVHGAEHAMRHVGQLSVTARIVRHSSPASA